MASINGLTDPLSSSSQNTTLWGGNFGTLSWTGGGFTISQLAAYTGYGGQASQLGTWDLTGTSFQVYMSSFGNQALTSLELVPFKLVKDASNNMEFYISNGTLSFTKTIAAAATTVATVAHNATTMKYFRVTESGGNCQAAYSADGLSWTNFGSAFANPFAVTALAVEMSMGTYNSEASATSAKWETINVAAVAPSNSKQFFAAL
jgi:hypothetical protein